MRHLARLLTLLFVSLYSCSNVEAEEPKLQPIPDRLVVLTFDDANKSDRTFVADILKKHGFGATFYVSEGLGFLKNKQHYTTWDEIRELHEMGFEIGNHTQHHRSVTSINGEQLKESVRHIEKRCKENNIPVPVTFCYPGFGHNAEAVKALDESGFLFARRGVRPEWQDNGEGSRGPAYDPQVDHPLLIPSTGYDGPDWKLDDLKWAVDQARDGKIAVLCFHGVPALDHPWVNTDPKDFKIYMQYLKDKECTVIALRDLVKYVDPQQRPADPYAPIRQRIESKKRSSE